jgi:ankyrin repeat protein
MVCRVAGTGWQTLLQSCYYCRATSDWLRIGWWRLEIVQIDATVILEKHEHVTLYIVKLEEYVYFFFPFHCRTFTMSIVELVSNITVIDPDVRELLMNAICDQIRTLAHNMGVDKDEKYKGEDLLRAHPLGVNAAQIAAQFGFTQIMSTLIEIGCDIESGTDIEPPLHRASLKNRVVIVEQLLDAGLDVNHMWQKWTPLCFAVAGNGPDVVDLLIRRGANMYCSRTSNRYLYGLVSCRKAVLCNFIKHGFDVNRPDRYLRCVLHYAVCHDAEQCAELLISTGADIEALNNDGKTPLDLAAQNGSIRSLIVLLVAGAIVDKVHSAFEQCHHWLLAASFNSNAVLDESVFESVRQKREQLEQFIVAKNKLRIVDICVALQSCEFPALVTLFIIDFLCDPCNRVSMHRKWNLIVAVKHFSTSKKE